MNKFFNTAIGQAIKVAAYAGLSAFIASLQVNVTAEQGLSFALINAGLVFLKGILDPTQPTFPGSKAVADYPATPKL